MSDISVHDVKKKYQSKIMRIKGVVGIGVGKDEEQDAIVVFIMERTTVIEKKVPKELKGFPVIVHEIGIVSAL